MQKSSRMGGILWLSVYIGLLAGIAVGMLQAHDKLVANSRRDLPSWTAFKQDTAEKARTKRGPVEHAIPPSDEPPMLVLLRDHFPMMFVASIIFPAIILGFLMLALRGAMRKPDQPKADAKKKPEMNANERESKTDDARIQVHTNVSVIMNENQRESKPEDTKPEEIKSDGAKPSP